MTGLPFLLRAFDFDRAQRSKRCVPIVASQELDMLQDIPTPTLREARACVLETERLTLRKPTLADVKAIARLANDRRIAENTRRLPHPYTQDDAIDFVRALGAGGRETVFLIENNHTPIGMVGIDWREEAAAELGYWLGVDHWGQGFGTEAARAVIDYFFEEFDLDQLIAGARVVNPSSRNILEKCGFQWSGVELHRFEALGSSSPVDAFRLSRGVWASLKSWNNSTRRES
ncbi:RimJ/RimL family protein N-acetyltransferase [Bradyrhizobium sp. JR3.5]